MSGLQLGLGLLSIGRTWGVQKSEPPSRQNAFHLLETALELGISFFDTAPAYGDSEEIFGAFIHAHGIGREITIATKFGEHWLGPKTPTKVDHSTKALKNSLERSQELLGRIDILQIHKANPQNIASDSVLQAIEHAKSAGVKEFGASVSDIDTALAVSALDAFRYVQFPLNTENTEFMPILEILAGSDTIPIINRPFNMGSVVGAAASPLNKSKTAFEFLHNSLSSGIVLTGTGRTVHLRENTHNFNACTAKGEAR